MAEPSIRVEGLRVVRGGKVALDSISLEVVPGIVTGLLGPSGGGKSTLMRATVGVQQVASGRITVLGLPAGSPELRSRVGYRTQAPSVYIDLTVRENVHYFGRVLGVSEAAVDEAIETVDLGAESAQIAGRLSGGQLARVALAMALLGEPEVLVLDEPTVGLDPLLRRDLWDTFHEIADRGATILVSSHVMDEADRCDELLLLREGRIIATGTPDELRRRTGAEDLDSVFLRLVEGDA
ncbi:MAG TPA: ABC transporter ATP-binding protein [Gaiellaceae bacterium]|nr:ABC transporter ATP-binding protein [Gaiellaceae bacterium]